MDQQIKMGHELNNPSALERTEKSFRSDSSKYNQGTAMKQLIHEQYNSARNLTPLLQRIKDGTARDLNSEPKAEGAPAIIIGSGPSLDESIEYLRDWEGGILCSSSHALTLMRYGIEPTHIVNLDPFSNFDEIDGIDWSKTRTKSVLHPGVNPDLVERWPNEILLYRQNNGRSDSFYSGLQKFMYSDRTGGRDNSTFTFHIVTELTIFACSPPAQMFVADRLGYGNIFLAGVDFGYHSGKERFTSWTIKEPEKVVTSGNSAPVVIPIQWERHDHPIGSELLGVDAIVTNNGLQTHPVHLYYKKNTMSAWRLSLQNVYTTDRGIITEMPYVDMKKVVEKQGRGFPRWPLERIKRVTEEYMASVGAYIIESERGGKNFVESADPEKELPEFMRGINRQYHCDQCQNSMIANVDADQTGQPCPICKGPIKRRNYADVEANMKRIKRRIARVQAVDSRPGTV